MIEPKPLSEQTAGWIKRGYLAPGPTDPHELIDELVAAEAYWRLAVKSAELIESGEAEQCPLCRAVNWILSREDHKPDCPWLLAQDGHE